MSADDNRPVTPESVKAMRDGLTAGKDRHQFLWDQNNKDR